MAVGEDDPLGGADPYSSSKACADLVTAAYRASFFAEAGCRIASVRAGNVIGGGDWAEDRLIPDAVRALIVRADEGASYMATFDVDLATLEPMVATPGDPRNGVPLRSLGATEKVALRKLLEKLTQPH